MLMDVETLLLMTSALHLVILTAELYPLTLSLSSSPRLDAMAPCCSLSTRSTCRNPRPTCTHHHRTAVHLLYPIPYASIYMQYILLTPQTCFSVPTLLTHVTVTL